MSRLICYEDELVQQQRNEEGHHSTVFRKRSRPNHGDLSPLEIRNSSHGPRTAACISGRSSATSDRLPPGRNISCRYTHHTALTILRGGCLSFISRRIDRPAATDLCALFRAVAGTTGGERF